MLRSKMGLFLVFVLVVGSGCTREQEKGQVSQKIGDAKLYTFSSDQRSFLSGPEKVELSSDTTVADALDILGKNLSKGYFSSTYEDNKSDIRFEIIKVENISIPSGSIRIGFINMIDPGEEAMKYFFQGSTGARTTFYMIAATFTQPHLDPPLLDGMVFLYNGKEFPRLDHINLRGIIPPRLVRHVALRALNSG